MTIRLRAHHLLCLLTYVGKGYTPAFVAQYDALVTRLNAGEEAVLVEGPDDICAPMLEGRHHCLKPRITARDAQALADLARLLGRPLRAGEPVPLDRGSVARMRRAFADGAIRQACAGCQWSELCTDIAAAGFAEVRVTGAEPPQ